METLKGAGEITLRAPRAVALYILNEKRAHLARLHADRGVFVSVVLDETLPHAGFSLERTADQARPSDIPAAPRALEPYAPADEDFEAFEDEPEDTDDDAVVEGEDDDDQDLRPRGGRSSQDDHDDEEGRGDRRGRRRRRRGRREPEARSAAPPSNGDASRDFRSEEEDDGQGGRRRRRGRRGGRRSRDEGRPQDAYAWTRPWVPYEDDPFIWFDPSQDTRSSADRPQGPAAEAPPAPPPAAPEDPSVDIWVELPEAEVQTSRRPRRSRARTRAAAEVQEAEVIPSTEEAPTPAVSEEAVATPDTEASEAPTKPVRARRSRVRSAEPAPEAPVAQEAESAEVPPAPVSAPAPEAAAPLAPRAPDPAEIVAPPEQPRKGWWRRG
jgi:ribonuclease E